MNHATRLNKEEKPMSMLTIRRFFTVVTLLFLVSACTSKEEQIAKAVKQQAQATEQALKQLEQAMGDNRIRNATVLTRYAESIASSNPELRPLAEQLATDATTAGPMYKNLFIRFEEAKNNPAAFVNWQERVNELQAISEGAQLSLFNDALSDPINVLADMSGGTLGRVNSMSREAEIRANNVDNAGPGSQLVGNPNYGNWQTNSSGMSFWAWYGMYSMFSNVMGYNNYRYDSWGRGRGYSYYNDYGRSRYSSPKQRLKQNKLYNKTKKSFASRGKSFSGPYSKRRVGSSSLSRSSYTATKRSSFAKKSSFSSGGSMRNSSSRTSRGTSRGK
jgi:hypothetical protein